jgi:GT2 family glycosyltransferase
MIQAIQERAFPLVYADEDLHRSGTRIRPLFKPDWSPHLIASRMYLGRAFIMATNQLRRFFCTGGGKSKDWRHDLLLKFAAADLPGHHVCRVLYHRSIESDAKEEDHRQVRRSIASSRCAPVRTQGCEVSIVICSRSPSVISRCLDSLNATAGPSVREVIVVAHEQAGRNIALRRAIERRGAVPMPFTGSFNFSLMNNLAVERVRSRHILFLNDDITASEPGWLECLLEQIERKGAGIAGAVLWYPSHVIQHAGIVSGSGDGVVHVGRYMRSSILWPWLLETRDVSAVTAACLCLPSDLFRSLGGFDTEFPNNYNDVDLCFRARANGYRVVCVAAPGLIHAECTTRQGIVRFEERYRFFKKWDSILGRPDPYYSPNLAATEIIQLDLIGKSGFRFLLGEE